MQRALIRPAFPESDQNLPIAAKVLKSGVVDCAIDQSVLGSVVGSVEAASRKKEGKIVHVGQSKDNRGMGDSPGH